MDIYAIIFVIIAMFPFSLVFLVVYAKYIKNKLRPKLQLVKDEVQVSKPKKSKKKNKGAKNARKN